MCAAGTAQCCCQVYDTGSVHFIPSVEVKMSYMSVRRVRVWAVSVVQVMCMPTDNIISHFLISFNYRFHSLYTDTCLQKKIIINK